MAKGGTYFDELMDVYDLRMKYIPEFIGKGMKGVAECG